MRDAAFALIWLGLLPMVFVSAQVGILLWIWVAILSPTDFLYGPMAGVPFNKLVAAVTICALFVSKERKDFYLDKMGALMLALLLAATLSWLFGLLPLDVTFDQYTKLVKELVLAAVIMWFMASRHWLHYILVTLCLTIGYFAVREALMVLLTAGGHKILGVVSIGDNNSVATAVLMCIPMMLYLAKYAELWITKVGLQLVAVLSVVCVVGTFSRGGFVGLVAMALMLIKNSRRKLLPLLGVAAAGVLLLVLAPESWFERLNTINEANQDGSFMGRVVVWKMSLLIALDRPFLGAGPHAVQFLPVWNAYKPYLPQVDFVTTPPPDVVPHAAHSIWFEVLGDFGFSGLLIFACIVLLGSLLCRRVVKLARLHPELAWAADMARMLQITLAVYAVTGSALSMTYFEVFWVVVAVVSRLHRTVRQEVRAKAAVPGPARAAALPPGLLPVPGPKRPAHAMRQVLPAAPARGHIRPIP